MSAALQNRPLSVVYGHLGVWRRRGRGRGRSSDVVAAPVSPLDVVGLWTVKGKSLCADTWGGSGSRGRHAYHILRAWKVSNWERPSKNIPSRTGQKVASKVCVTVRSGDLVFQALGTKSSGRTKGRAMADSYIPCRLNTRPDFGSIREACVRNPGPWGG